MPSPFPGMDPYLESPNLWPGVHQGLIGVCRAELNSSLPSPYVADIGERLVVVQNERSIYPDALVIQRAEPRGEWESTSATAVADPPWVLEAINEEMREVFIQIVLPNESDLVVTLIEVLSPANKAAGSEGREQYLQKQQEILDSGTHLIEIDFLRHGAHTVAASRNRLLSKGTWDYLVCLTRAGEKRERHEAWSISLRERLPRISVPLCAGDGDVVLDLQKVFDQCYNDGAYARRIDYSKPPVGDLNDADSAWAADVISAAGNA